MIWGSRRHHWTPGARDPKVLALTSLRAMELMKPGQPWMQGTLWSFTALCLQPASCLSELAAAPSLGLMQQSDNEQYISVVEKGGEGERGGRLSKPA